MFVLPRAVLGKQVAARWGNLGRLLDAFSDSSLSEKQRRDLLVGPGIPTSGRNIGSAASRAVYELMMKRDPEEWVDRGDD